MLEQQPRYFLTQFRNKKGEWVYYAFWHPLHEELPVKLNYREYYFLKGHHEFFEFPADDLKALSKVATKLSKLMKQDEE